MRTGFMQSVSVITIALALAACGGGGDTRPAVRTQTPTTVTPPPPPPPEPDPVPSDFRTSEYNRNGWAYDAVNAAEAYALGYTGEGVTIGIFDFNFNLNDIDINFHSASVRKSLNYVNIYEAQIGDTAPTDPHGQAVAAVAGARKNNVGIHGIAFDAQILAVDFFSGLNVEQVQQNGDTYYVADPFTYMAQNGARIVNKSLGYDESDVIDNPPDVAEYYVNDTDAIAVARGMLLVAAAGNNGQDEPMLSVLETIDVLQDNNLLDSGDGALIIVGAVGQDLMLSDFSNAAGAAANHFIVAPGEDIVFPYTNGDLFQGDGTSFASPIVSGAAAIIMSRWPFLTAREVRQILFDSARDLGAAGVDAVYGHGLLDIEAALSPVGTTTIATANGTPAPVTTTAISFSGPYGNAAALAESLSSVMILDGFNRDFQTDLSSLTIPGQNRGHFANVFNNRQAWLGSAKTIGQSSSLNFGFQQDPFQRANLINASQGIQDSYAQPDVMVEFNGSFKGIDFTAGRGLSLTTALSRDASALRPDSQSPLMLTGQNQAGINTGAGIYSFADVAVGTNGTATLGFSFGQHDGLNHHAVRDLREDNKTFALASAYHHRLGQTAFGAEIGLMLENGSVLGARSAGALALADQAATGWLTFTAQHNLSRRFSLFASMTGGVTEADSMTGTLFGDMGTMLSSSFKLALSGKEILGDQDRITFGIVQPLRIERARTTLLTAVDRDWNTGAIYFSPQSINITPDGREIGFEMAYQISLGQWTGFLNTAYRMNADHIKGRGEGVALLGINRRF